MSAVILGQGKFSVVTVAIHLVLFMPGECDVVFNGPVEIRTKFIDLSPLLLFVFNANFLGVDPGE